MNLTYEEKDKYIYIKANNKKNFSLKKSNYFQTYLKSENKFLEAYPIKPIQNIIPKDISLHKIFVIQKACSQKINKKFEFLSDIDINNASFSRKKILNKIKEFILRHHIDYKIYYKTIILYDILLIENKYKKLLSNEEIALGALVLSVKFNYIENKMISMKKFLELYSDKKYNLKHLIRIERICLFLSQYYLNFNTPMCFLEFFLINGIIFSNDNIKHDNYNKIYYQLEKILEGIMEESNNYLKFNFFHLACAIVSYARENFDLKKWPLTLKKIFGIEYITFEKEYNSLFIKSNDYKTNNTNNKKEIIIRGNNNTILLNFPDKSSRNKKLTKSNTSNFHLYQKNSNDLDNKYCNNIINININNYSINNNIKSYLYKRGINPINPMNSFKNLKFNTNKNENNEQKDKSETRIIKKHLYRTTIKEKNDLDDKNNKTMYCSPAKKKTKLINYLLNQKKEILDELEEENSKNSSNELNNELNKTYKRKKNYNFSSRFKLKTYKSTFNLNSFISEKNKINNQKSRLLELKNTINEYNQMKLKLSNHEETPKNNSLIKTNNLDNKFQKKKYYINNKNTINSENKTEKKAFPVKSMINSTAFETPNKPKGIKRINFDINSYNEKDKKENKTKIKFRYNNLIKYKLSIASSFKAKNFQ